MTQNFVMAFGGTGARCAEAITYLLASRTLLQPAHIILVDPDQTNGNVKETLWQLQRYAEIHRELVDRSATPSSPFFSTPLNTEGGSESFIWTNPQPNVPFSSLI